MVCLVLTWRILDAASGTDVAHDAMPYKILTQPILRSHVLYRDSSWCYAISGTDIAYGDVLSPLLRSRMMLFYV
eukprot:2514590-Rhodomonas_salina.3